LASLVLGKKQLDPELLEALEEQLIMADLGLETTERVLELLRQRLDRKALAAEESVLSALKETLVELLEDQERALSLDQHKPFVILVVGVNGAGKTTTIGKLAHRFKREGRSVMLAAGDTFRAAAVEQLQAWGDRHEVPVIAQHSGADSASVLFDALEAARARSVDVLIADTAGRLQNKSHLMDELSKVVRVMRKQDDTVPHETLLVLDAGTGQNAVSQAVEFDQAVGVSGVAVTKLDGTARGGVLFAIAHKLKRPIRFIGVGEQPEDLRDFSARDFVNALLDEH
jgi:fused signal recognition particle receptor